MENTAKTHDDLLEVKDVMEMYHVTRLTVYRWIESGKLEGRKAGHKWLFTRDQVSAILK